MVRSGDNAHRIAAAFVVQHSLDPACVRPLASRIHHAIADYAQELEGQDMASNTKPVPLLLLYPLTSSLFFSPLLRSPLLSASSSSPLLLISYKDAHPSRRSITFQQPFNLSSPSARRQEILSFTVDMGSGKVSSFLSPLISSHPISSPSPLLPLLLLLLFLLLYCFDINKKGSITVREGDDPHQLARNFVKTFQLRKSLVGYIANQILEQSSLPFLLPLHFPPLLSHPPLPLPSPSSFLMIIQ